MTIAEQKSSIVAQLNQQALNVVVEQLATISVQHEELKAEHAALKAKHDAITKATDRAEPLPV